MSSHDIVLFNHPVLRLQLSDCIVIDVPVACSLFWGGFCILLILIFCFQMRLHQAFSKEFELLQRVQMDLWSILFLQVLVFVVKQWIREIWHDRGPFSLMQALTLPQSSLQWVYATCCNYSVWTHVLSMCDSLIRSSHWQYIVFMLAPESSGSLVLEARVLGRFLD